VPCRVVQGLPKWGDSRAAAELQVALAVGRSGLLSALDTGLLHLPSLLPQGCLLECMAMLVSATTG
jgi:hypothetical protein